MKPATSLYLDILRFGAALTVFFAHYSSGRLSGGLFWQVQGYGHLAVMTFFVLSGLVIAYSAETKERTLHVYCVSRLSRLYSVVVPAVFLTIALNSIGTRVAPQLYTADWGFDASEPLLRIAMALTFTSEIWFADYQIFSMGPFWSLPFEVWYYVLFALVLFLPGRKRWLAAALAMLIAGPRILFLLPIWLIGVVVYHSLGRIHIRHGVGWALFLGSAAVFALCQYLDFRDHSRALAETLTSQNLIRLYCQESWNPYDYLVGLLVAASIVGFDAIGDSFTELLRSMQPAIRWLAGLTFSLYLFHMPLLLFYKAVSPWPAGDWRNRIFLAVVPLVSVAVLGSITERRRGALRRWLARAIPDAGRWPVMGRKPALVARVPRPLPAAAFAVTVQQRDRGYALGSSDAPGSD